MCMMRQWTTTATSRRTSLVAGEATHRVGRTAAAAVVAPKVAAAATTISATCQFDANARAVELDAVHVANSVVGVAFVFVVDEREALLHRREPDAAKLLKCLGLRTEEECSVSLV